MANNACLAQPPHYTHLDWVYIVRQSGHCGTMGVNGLRVSYKIFILYIYYPDIVTFVLVYIFNVEHSGETFQQKVF